MQYTDTEAYVWNKDRRVTVLLDSPETRERVEKTVDSIERKRQDGFREIFMLGFDEYKKKHKIK